MSRDLMDLLIGDIFRNAARAVPGRTAAVLGDERITYGELDRRANQLARVLAGRGVGLGDRVVLWSGTSLASVPVFAALAKLGAVFAPMNPGLHPDEAVAILRYAEPAMIVSDAERAATAADLAATVGAAAVDLDTLTEASNAEPADDVVAPGLTERDPHVVFFTSGSTGLPKGAILSHRTNFLRTLHGPLLEPRGPMVSPYPLFHMGAWTIALQQWQGRDTLVLLEGTDGATIVTAIERHRATRLNCIPALWRRILDHLATPTGRAVDVSSVRFADTGTSATPLELLQAIASAFPNAQVRVFYGSTESGGVTMLEHADVEAKPGSCGLPAPYAEVRLDVTGELLVRSAVLFDGYYGNPEATAEVMHDGWYRTGDLADIDSDGYVTIVGRARDIIRTGGETVAPGEVEGVLSAHPAVADVAVVGVPDVQWGEVVCAVIVAAPGCPSPGVGELRAFCEGKLASHKQPRSVASTDAIPRTASTNQVQRRLLLEQLATGALSVTAR